MKIPEILREQRRGVSFEFFPPKTEKGRANLAGCADVLKKYEPLFVSATYGAGGGNKDTAVDTVISLNKSDEMTVMPHLTCIGAQAPELDGILSVYEKNGIENILALRGDPPAGDETFDVSSGDFPHASDMISHISEKYPFALAAAAYPEGHFEAASLGEDIENTKKKIDAGARFLITQMFFNNAHFYSFREKLKKAEIDVPVLAGIMPILNFGKIRDLANNYAKVEIPEKLSRLMEPLAESPEDQKKAGIEYAVRQCEDLKSNGVGFFHFFVLNRPDAAVKIIEAAGLG